MKKLWILLLISISAFTQNNETDSFIGKWNVVEILNETPAQGKNQEIEMAKIFLNSIFYFNKDGSFELTLKSPSQFATELKQMTKGVKWKFISKSNMIMIGNKEDNYSIIGIQHLKNDNGHFFKLMESGLILKVLKI
jgi:hypothetical protein